MEPTHSSPAGVRAGRQSVNLGLAQPQGGSPFDFSAQPAQQTEKPKGAAHWNARMLADYAADKEFVPDSKAAEKLRSQGFTLAVATPQRGIFRGMSALVDLGDGPVSDLVVKRTVAQHISFEQSGGFQSGYPNSLMGVIAFIRQMYYDADWYRKAHDSYAKSPAGQARPEANTALAALADAVQTRMPVIMDVAADSINIPGIVTMSATANDKEMFGVVDAPDGSSYNWTAIRKEPARDEPDTTKPKKPEMATSSVTFPPAEYGRSKPPEQPELILIKNGTVWTQGPQGKLVHADVFVTKGKITKVGTNLTAPAGAAIIDATNKHVSPGIIDSHSHTAAASINEGGQAITCETRIRYHETDPRWQAMIPVLEGTIPVFVTANELCQIQAAITWAEAEGVKLVIVGGKDAWLVRAQLKAKNIPVIITDIQSAPARRWQGYDEVFTLPMRLHQAGVRFCITGDGGASNSRNTAYHAANATAYGLPKDEALKSVTIYAAQILGIADRVGSLEVGKDATLIITNGDPLEIPTETEQMFIQGKKINLTDKHQQLYEKYKQKYRQVNEQ